MNKKIIISLAVVVVLALGVVLVYPRDTQASGNTVLEPKGDLFTGKISSPSVSPGKYKGMGVYDRSCNMRPDGLTSCDGGITTEEFGVLNFKYTHNMQQQPCLAPNDIVVVTVLDKEGNAKVQRM